MILLQALASLCALPVATALLLVVEALGLAVWGLAGLLARVELLAERLRERVAQETML